MSIIDRAKRFLFTPQEMTPVTHNGFRQYDFYSVPHVVPPLDYIQDALLLTNKIIDNRTVQFVLKHANESKNLIETTVNPKVFFERYDFALANLDVLYRLEQSGAIRTTTNPPSQVLNMLVLEREQRIRSFLTRSYNDLSQKLQPLKTERARQNRVVKWCDALLLYCYLLQADTVAWITSTRTSALSSGS